MVKTATKAAPKGKKPHPMIKSVTSDQHKTTPLSAKAKAGDKMTAAKAPKATATDKVTVTEVKSANNGHITIAVLSNGKVEPIDAIQKAGVTVKAGQVWDDVQLAFKATGQTKGTGHLANGLTGHTAPHSAKAVADNRAAAKAEPKAKAASKATPTKSVVKDDNRKISLTQKGKDKLAAGGSTGAVLNIGRLAKVATVSAALTSGLKMADISYAVKTGTIKLG